MYAPRETKGQWQLMDKNIDPTKDTIWAKEGDDGYTNYGLLRQTLQVPGVKNDVAKVFNAPAAGVLKIAMSSDENAALVTDKGGRQVNFKILKNDERVFPIDKEWLTISSTSETSDKIRPFDDMPGKALSINVEKGDAIRIVTSMIDASTRGPVYYYYGGFFMTYNKGSQSNGIVIDKSSVTLKEGDVETITARTIGQNTAIKYQSADPSIATVDLNGHIKGINTGNCKIYAYTNDGAIADYCEVEVKQADVLIGKPVVTLKGTSILETKVNAICNSGTMNITIIAVTRDEKGKVQNVAQQPYTLSAGDNKELTVDVNVTEVSKLINVYIWDSIEGLKPIVGGCGYYSPIN